MNVSVKYEYIKNFKDLGFGIFVHFGLYSVIGKGEWYYFTIAKNESAKKKYLELPSVFRVRKDWAKSIVKTAKKAGAKYIVLTTRHHDGFSLYDTCGLSDFDALHSAGGRDLIAEYVEACREEGIIPFFYHTLCDWVHENYLTNFPKYLDYLIASLEILCKNYGKIGGFWFDGMWYSPNENWQEDRIYGTIRKYQPEAIIVNNTGLSAQGKTGHREIDCVTFERGKPFTVRNENKPIAGEVCQALNDHWGYAKNDLNYKSFKELVESLVDCRKFGCNFLLNIGPEGNGSVRSVERYLVEMLGAWIKANKNFIYSSQGVSIACEGGDVLSDGSNYYVAVKNVPMELDPNVSLEVPVGKVRLGKQIGRAYWLDNGEEISVRGNTFEVTPFGYGNSMSVRIAKIEWKE